MINVKKILLLQVVLFIKQGDFSTHPYG